MMEELFGNSEDLNALQMGARAFVCFFVMIALSRLGGMRAFSKKSAFDVIVVISLGAVFSRVIVGASPAVPTVIAATVLVVLHRVIAISTARWPALERLVKGCSHPVYRGGIFDLARMHRAGISRADIEQSVRKHVNNLTLADVLEVRLEATGELSVIEDTVGKRNRENRLDVATSASQ